MVHTLGKHFQLFSYSGWYTVRLGESDPWCNTDLGSLAIFENNAGLI